MMTFDLTGKETSAPGQGRRGGISKLSASSKEGMLNLSIVREFEGPMGSISIKTTETWSLSEDGNTLTVSSESETPRGVRNAKMVFTRKTE